MTMRRVHQPPPDLTGFVKLIEGKHFAVGLRCDREDRHLSFCVMYKDDDGQGEPQWWLVQNHRMAYEHGVSSVCLEDLADVTAKAVAWCKDNCDRYTPPNLKGDPMFHGWALRKNQPSQA
jgi:hypothetical protein